MHDITSFYDNLDLKYQEIGIAIEEIDTSKPSMVKMVIPVLTPNLKNSEKTEDTIRQDAKNIQNHSKVTIQNVKVSNYIEVPFPIEIFGGITSKIPAGSKWVLSFVGGDVTKPRVVSRYLDTDLANDDFEKAADIKISPDEGNSIEERENGLYVPEIKNEENEPIIFDKAIDLLLEIFLFDFDNETLHNGSGYITKDDPDIAYIFENKSEKSKYFIYDFIDRFKDILLSFRPVSESYDYTGLDSSVKYEYIDNVNIINYNLEDTIKNNNLLFTLLRELGLKNSDISIYACEMKNIFDYIIDLYVFMTFSCLYNIDYNFYNNNYETFLKNKKYNYNYYKSMLNKIHTYSGELSSEYLFAFKKYFRIINHYNEIEVEKFNKKLSILICEIFRFLDLSLFWHDYEDNTESYNKNGLYDYACDRNENHHIISKTGQTLTNEECLDRLSIFPVGRIDIDESAHSAVLSSFMLDSTSYDEFIKMRKNNTWFDFTYILYTYLLFVYRYGGITPAVFDFDHYLLLENNYYSGKYLHYFSVIKSHIDGNVELVQSGSITYGTNIGEEFRVDNQQALLLLTIMAYKFNNGNTKYSMRPIEKVVFPVMLLLLDKNRDYRSVGIVQDQTISDFLLEYVNDNAPNYSIDFAINKSFTKKYMIGKENPLPYFDITEDELIPVPDFNMIKNDGNLYKYVPDHTGLYAIVTSLNHFYIFPKTKYGSYEKGYESSKIKSKSFYYGTTTTMYAHFYYLEEGKEYLLAPFLLNKIDYSNLFILYYHDNTNMLSINTDYSYEYWNSNIVRINTYDESDSSEFVGKFGVINGSFTKLVDFLDKEASNTAIDTSKYTSYYAYPTNSTQAFLEGDFVGIMQNDLLFDYSAEDANMFSSSVYLYTGFYHPNTLFIESMMASNFIININLTNGNKISSKDFTPIKYYTLGNEADIFGRNLAIYKFNNDILYQYIDKSFDKDTYTFKHTFYFENKYNGQYSEGQRLGYVDNLEVSVQTVISNLIDQAFDRLRMNDGGIKLYMDNPDSKRPNNKNKKIEIYNIGKSNSFTFINKIYDRDLTDSVVLLDIGKRVYFTVKVNDLTKYPIHKHMGSLELKTYEEDNNPLRSYTFDDKITYVGEYSNTDRPSIKELIFEVEFKVHFEEF